MDKEIGIERVTPFGKLNKAIRIVDSISTWVGKGVSFLIFPVIAAIVYEVIMRYFLRKSQLWVPETSQFLYGALFILGGAYTYLHDGHVRMDAVYSKLSPRTRASLNIFTALFFFFFCAVLLLNSWTTGWESFTIRERTSSAFEPPLYPIKLIIPVGTGLLLLQGIAKFIRDIFLVAGRADR